MDEIIGEKEGITYQQIFDSLAQLRFVLFQGRPGSGKTTLMTKISRDWANGVFMESKLLFLVPLRRLNTFSKRTLATLIQVACPPFEQDEIKSLEGAIKAIKGRNVVFIFDGFDEYSPDSNSDIVLNLMDTWRNFLRDAFVVVSSRPAACQDFRQYADKQIEVVGFLKEHIVKYIQSYYQDNEGKAQELLTHLEQHPNVMNMCYLPLHCAMLVFLYDGNAVLPKTESEFYKHFTISTLLRSVRKRKGSVTCMTSFDQLSPKDKALFDKICKLAFEATIARKQVFMQSELHEIAFECSSKGNDESCLGLVVIDRCFMRFGLDETYTFLHLTFQEFLAAVHISQLSPANICQIIRNYRNLNVVYKFLCGMTNFSLPNAKQIFDELDSTQLTGELNVIHCAYESQQPYLFDYLIKKRNGIFCLSSYSFAQFKLPDIPIITLLLNNPLCRSIDFFDLSMYKAETNHLDNQLESLFVEQF